MDLQTLFTTDFWAVASSISVATVFFAGLINNKFGINKGIWPQIVAWATAALFSVGAWFFNLITLGEPAWAALITLCVVTGLSSNGIYDIPAIKGWIDSLPKNKTTTETTI